jgi:hypothetical protein
MNGPRPELLNWNKFVHAHWIDLINSPKLLAFSAQLSELT